MCCTTGVVSVAIIPDIENSIATAISNMHSRIDGIFDNPLTSTWHYFLEYQFFSGGEGLPISKSINIGYCLRITRQKSIIYFSPSYIKTFASLLIIPSAISILHACQRPFNPAFATFSFSSHGYLKYQIRLKSY